MSVRRTSLGQLAVHLSGIALVGAIAWSVGAAHETVGAAIVVIAAVAAVCWAVLGTLWWLIRLILRKDDTSQIPLADSVNSDQRELRATPAAASCVEDISEIIRPHTAPENWVWRDQFDDPKEGPMVPTLREVGLEAILRRPIVSATTRAGSYGMGGPGFLKLELAATDDRPTEWLLLCLWAAAEWCLFDDRPIESWSTPEPYGNKEFIADVTGKIIETAEVHDQSCLLVISGAGKRHRLQVPSDTSKLPVQRGDKKRRNLAPYDSLWDAWALSREEYVFI